MTNSKQTINQLTGNDRNLRFFLDNDLYEFSIPDYLTDLKEQIESGTLTVRYLKEFSPKDLQTLIDKHANELYIDAQQAESDMYEENEQIYDEEQSEDAGIDDDDYYSESDMEDCYDSYDQYLKSSFKAQLAQLDADIHLLDKNIKKGQSAKGYAEHSEPVTNGHALHVQTTLDTIGFEFDPAGTDVIRKIQFFIKNKKTTDLNKLSQVGYQILTEGQTTLAKELDHPANTWQAIDQHYAALAERKSSALLSQSKDNSEPSR